MIPGTAVDVEALADHLRELADGLEAGDVDLLEASDSLAAAGGEPLEAGLELTYIPPADRPDLLVALEVDPDRLDRRTRARALGEGLEDLDPDRSPDDPGPLVEYALDRDTPSDSEGSSPPRGD